MNSVTVDGKVSESVSKRRGGGSRKGCPNKATAQAREALRVFVEGNLHQLQAWLDQVANGVWCEEEGKYIVAPDPHRAFQMLTALIEFTLPKLQRTDVGLNGEMTAKTFNIRRVVSIDGQASSDLQI